MKIYTTDDETTLDLEHVLAVGPVSEDCSYLGAYSYSLTLAFNSSKSIIYYNEAKAKACREKLINAWKTSKENDRA